MYETTKSKIEVKKNLFDVLILKINFKKIKKYYFYIFINELL
jgi:hypothetical protein